MLWDWRLERKWSAVGFCSGAISGLVAITPGSGFVGAPAAVAFGFLGGTACNFATQLKFIFGFDETLDIFAVHGIGGIVRNVRLPSPYFSDCLIIDLFRSALRSLPKRLLLASTVSRRSTEAGSITTGFNSHTRLPIQQLASDTLSS